jgi:hypothetical protein
MVPRLTRNLAHGHPSLKLPISSQTDIQLIRYRKLVRNHGTKPGDDLTHSSGREGGSCLRKNLRLHSACICLYDSKSDICMLRYAASVLVVE